MSTCHWNYTCGDGGPLTWAQYFPAAGGAQQSPIDIEERLAVFDPCLKKNPLNINYQPNCVKCISNTGHNWMVAVDGKNCILNGGPLVNKYQLEQFHVHWGSEDNYGSEHTINGKSYAAELHIVHYNKDKFATFGEAASAKDGLAVLGIFMEVGPKHKELEVLTKCMCNIKYTSQCADLDGEFNLTSLLPVNTNKYWTYPGSLTTPPCYESVTWIVFQEPITVSKEQMEAMRSLLCYCQGESAPKDGLGGKLANNYRPTVPLGDRKLSKSFL